MFKKVSMRSTLTLMFFTIMLIFSAILFYNDYENVLERQIDAEIEKIRVSLNEKEGIIERLLRFVGSRKIGRVITDYTFGDNMKAIYLIDNKGIVVDSNILGSRDKSIDKLISKEQVKYLNEAMEKNWSVIKVIENEGEIIAVAPLLYYRKEHPFHKSKFGALIEVYNFTSIKKEILNSEINNSLITFMIFAISLVVIALIIQRLYINRIINIQHGIISFGSGNTATRVKVSGRDEIKELAEEVNTLFENINSSNEKVTRIYSQLQAIAENTTSLISIRNIEGEFLFANKAFTALFGIKSIEIMGKPYSKVLPKEIAESIQKLDQKIIKTKQGLEVNGKLVHEGKVLFVSRNFFPLFDKNNEIYAIGSVTKDITEINKLYNQLDESKKALDLAQKISKLGSWTYDIDNGVMEWSDETYEIYGAERGGVNLNDFNEMTLPIHQADRENVQSVVLEAIKEKKDFSLQHMIMTKLGVTKFVEHDGKYFYDDAKGHHYMIGAVRDITEEKKLQEEIKQYIHLIDNQIITTSANLDGIITYVSEAFCKISGFNKSELLGKEHNFLLHPDNDLDLLEQIEHAERTQEHWSGEVKYLTKSGGEYWVSMTISPKYDLFGNHVGYTSIRQDITDKKKVEALSVTDELTQVFNRRHFNNVFEMEIRRAMRSKAMFSFVMMDVDNFKKYNDTYGHQKGDEVLKVIGELINTIFQRAGDFGFRLGGEEFGAIFITETEEEAYEIVENFRITLESKKIKHKKNDASHFVTSSFGLITLDFLNNDTVEVDKDVIYNLADKALYTAKESGRNRIEVVKNPIKNFSA